MSGAEELRKLSSDLRAAGPRVLPKARLVVQKVTSDIVRDAKILAPVDTGRLRDSIGHTDTSTADTISSEIGPTVNYGEFVELGTSRMNAQPYLGPATDRHEPVFEQAMAKIAEEAIDGR